VKTLALHTMGHDTGACLFEDGKLLFSIETERLTRHKHDHRAQIALDYLLSRVPVASDEIDLVAVSTNFRNGLMQLADPSVAQERIAAGQPHHETFCELLGRRTPCVVVAHEASHATLGWHYAGYADRCLVLVNEGQGTFSRNSLFLADRHALRLLEHDALPWYATGFGWSALGYLFGLGKGPAVAGKVMAIGGYAAPSPLLRELLLGIDPRIHYASRAAQEVQLERLRRAVDLADFTAQATLVATLQELFSETLADYLGRQVAAAGAGHLALGGGCALNLNANSHIGRRVMWPAVGPACNDAGQALGAGLYAERVLLGTTPAPFSPYCNGAVDERDYPARFARYGLAPRPLDLGFAARALADGAVIAWCDGVSEIGPRALGHRSLLANPALPGMRKRVSEGIKHREWYRPLSPIMREESFRQLWPDERPSPYMLFSYQVGSDAFAEAVHADRSARVQTVTPEMNPRMHALLGEFERTSGVPALINTSLNGRDRAIALDLDHVLEDFADSDVDYFVAGDVLAPSRRLGAG
jgi:carbamoyltransferase